MTLSLGEMVKELTEPTRQRVRRANGTTEWVVSAPSLLDQLSSLEPSSGEGVRRGFGSRPTARLEAIDLAALIDREASGWLKTLGEDDDGDAKTCVRRLHSLTPQLTGDLVDEITSYVRKWYVSSRIMSGWDVAPWSPANSCPACSEYGTLRVRVDERIGHCTACRATWTPETLGLLADHVRLENGDTAA